MLDGQVWHLVQIPDGEQPEVLSGSLTLIAHRLMEIIARNQKGEEIVALVFVGAQAHITQGPFPNLIWPDNSTQTALYRLPTLEDPDVIDSRNMPGAPLDLENPLLSYRHPDPEQDAEFETVEEADGDAGPEWGSEAELPEAEEAEADES